MTEKQLKTCRAGLAAILGIVIGVAVSAGNYYVPIAAFAVGLAIMQLCRRQTKEIIADERDVKIRQKSSRAAAAIFSVVSALTGATMIAASKNYPELLAPGLTLAYAICALLVLDAMLYHYYNRKGE